MNDCIEPTSTHLPVLVFAALSTSGPIIEMGCGFYSTPLLHAICEKQGRYLVSLDNNSEWVEKFDYLRKDWHVIKAVDWEEYVQLIDNTHWGVVFLDQSPAHERGLWLQRIKTKADLIVCHDSEEINCQYDFSSFLFKYEYNVYFPPTMVVSMNRPFSF